MEQQQESEKQGDTAALKTKSNNGTETSAAGPIPKTPNNTPNPLSKNQQKKRARFEKAQAAKKRRKEQEREIKKVKAKHEGRDLEKEREQQLQNEKEGKGWERREQLWKQKMIDADVENSFRVCFDCCFDEQMTWKEKNSLGLQLRYTYSRNRKSVRPVYIDVCSMVKGCETRSHLEKVVGFPESWKGRAFNTYETGIDEVYGLRTQSVDGVAAENPAEDAKSGHSELEQTGAADDAQAASELEAKPKKKLVYLTGDSPNTISTLDNNTTYIIGGIVDRNRLKRAAINRAESLNIPTARLPLEESLDFKGSTRVLTCNHVFEILLKYRENGYKDWKDAILSVLPERKDVQEKNQDEDEANISVGPTDADDQISGDNKDSPNT